MFPRVIISRYGRQRRQLRRTEKVLSCSQSRSEKHKELFVSFIVLYIYCNDTVITLLLMNIFNILVSTQLSVSASQRLVESTFLSFVNLIFLHFFAMKKKHFEYFTLGSGNL